MERNLEEKLDLTSPVSTDTNSGLEVNVIFRVYAGDYAVSDAMYIAGTNAALGDSVPNRIAMYDDGTHGDQRAGDKVWSLGVKLLRGKTVFYVYTNSGKEGEWQNVDIPDIRRFAVDAEKTAKTIYAPVDTFGRMYMQADGWHTNAAGYQLIAEAILRKLKAVPRFREYAEQSPNGPDTSRQVRHVVP